MQNPIPFKPCLCSSQGWHPPHLLQFTLERCLHLVAGDVEGLFGPCHEAFSFHADAIPKQRAAGKWRKPASLGFPRDDREAEKDGQ